MNRVITLFVSIFVHSEELHNMHSSPNIWQIKENEVGGACGGTYGRGEKSVQDFGAKPRRKVTTGRTGWHPRQLPSWPAP
jgi:hypothetical protein